MLQLRVSVDDPEHALPLYFGAGLVHVRVRVCDPAPHDLLHVPQAPKADHPPWMGL